MRRLPLILRLAVAASLLAAPHLGRRETGAWHLPAIVRADDLAAFAPVARGLPVFRAPAGPSRPGSALPRLDRSLGLVPLGFAAPRPAGVFRAADLALASGPLAGLRSPRFPTGPPPAVSIS